MSRCVNCQRRMPDEVRVSPDRRCKNRWCVDCQAQLGAFFLNWLYWERKAAKERGPVQPIALPEDPYASS